MVKLRKTITPIALLFMLLGEVLSSQSIVGVQTPSKVRRWVVDLFGYGNRILEILEATPYRSACLWFCAYFIAYLNFIQRDPTGVPSESSCIPSGNRIFLLPFRDELNLAPENPMPAP